MNPKNNSQQLPAQDAPDTINDAPRMDDAVSRRSKQLSRRRFLQRSLLLAGAVSTGELARETNTIEITRHTLRLRGLKTPCRLAQISDLHRSWCVSEGFIARIVGLTNDLKPDIIALTGDYVTRHADYIGSCVTALKPLRAPQGIFAVLGNHDYKADNYRGAPVVLDGLRWLNAQVLTNRSVRLENGLRLIGVDDFREGKPDPDAAFAAMRRGEATLAMTHSPFMFPRMRRYDCVTIAGHTHGGQVNIPGLTQLLMPGRLHYQQGWYKDAEGPGRLYVSRGLGVVGTPFRFNSLPEIAVFDLVPA